jgi:uncharacterized membrane protein
VDPYVLIKFVHVLLAIIAVGFNASYGVWLARAARDREHLGHVLRGIKILDDRFANPGYGLLLVTGLAMVFVGGIPITTFWIAAALVLWILTVVLGLWVYRPLLRRQITALESSGAGSVEYEAVARPAQVLGLALMVPIVMIVFFMVVKPTL